MPDSEQPTPIPPDASPLSPNPADDPRPTRPTPALIAVAVVVLIAVAVLAWQCTQSVSVPNVVGATQADATSQLTEAGLTAGAVSEEATLAAEPGTVVAQAPAPDTKAKKGSKVDLTVAVLPTAYVPDVIGMSESEAEATLAGEGLRTGEVKGSYSQDVKAGLVLSQTPDVGTEANVGDMVDLEISLGPEMSAVPDVVGMASTDADAVLKAAGFDAKQAKATSNDVEPGYVISQAPEAGSKADEGALVKYTVSTGPAAKPEEPTDEPAEQPNEPEADAPSDSTPEQPSPPDEPADEAPTPDPKPPVEKPVTVSVPDVVGMRVLEAVRTLKKAKLGYKIAWGEAEDGFLGVVAQDPKAGTEVDPGTVVTIEIGLPEFIYNEDGVQQLPSKPATTLPAPDDTEPSSETTP